MFCFSQSAYRPGHSTEVALLKVMNDILCTSDDSNIPVLTLLDLSAAFDTINHKSLLARLKNLYDIFGTALYVVVWVLSLWKDLNGDHRQQELKTILFVLWCTAGLCPRPRFTRPLSNLIDRHSIPSHIFADDTQLLHSCHPDHFDTTVQRLHACTTHAELHEVKWWLHCNKLNSDNELRK